MNALLRSIAAALFLPAAAASAHAQPAGEQAILQLLHRQETDWNTGNLDAFATGYENAPDILFIGSTISRGYDAMLAGYRKHYPTKEAMGRLKFHALEVQPLDTQFATATGQFHLERSASGGGNADGYFLLVLEHTPDGWKIVRDDTTVPSKP